MLALSKRLIIHARSRVELHEGLDPLRGWLHELSSREIGMVEYLWRGCRRTGLRRAALSISWLGNGLAYLLLGLAILIAVPGSTLTVLAAALSIGVAHLIYPWTKLACARSRPCEFRTELEQVLASLDRHSFPSGHAMTLAATLVPLVAAYPGVWPPAAVMTTAMGWSRIACGHHYPSDVLAGYLMGGAIALPITYALLLL